MSKTNYNNLTSQDESQWVVVGDSSRFIIFEKRRGKALSSLKLFTNETAHLKISEMQSDQPGRSFDSHSHSRHAYGKEHNPKEHALDVFVKQVSEFLEKENESQSFKSLVLIVEDKVLGKLRNLLNASTQANISQVHSKDLAWMSGSDLQQRVENILRPE